MLCRFTTVCAGWVGGNCIIVTYLLATNDDGDVDGQSLLELLNSGSQASTLSTALGIVVL